MLVQKYKNKHKELDKNQKKELLEFEKPAKTSFVKEKTNEGKIIYELICNKLFLFNNFFLSLENIAKSKLLGKTNSQLEMEESHP